MNIEKLKKFIMEELERTLRWKETHWQLSTDKKLSEDEREQNLNMYKHYQGEKFALIQVYEYIARLEYEEEDK